MHPVLTLRGPTLVCLVLSSCAPDEGLPASATEAVRTCAAIADAEYADAAARAVAMRTAVDAFVADPTESTLRAARTAWIAARTPYLQTETWRGADGPIEDVEGRVNPWPVNEAHLDYVETAGGPSYGGVVNDGTFVIDADALAAAHQALGENDVTLGFHAIEFLLWGQDRAVDGPGARPATDFVTTAAATAPNGDRRGALLALTAELLEADLAGVSASWHAGGTYRRSFESTRSTRQALRTVFTSLVWFSSSELGGDRLAGLATGDQEDEHSCFSDTTRTDFVEDQRGVRNLYVGRYVGIDGRIVEGPGLRDVLEDVDPALAAALGTRIDTSLALAEALHDPFDQEIAPTNTAGNARVQALFVSLGEQTRLLIEAADALSLTPLGTP